MITTNRIESVEPLKNLTPLTKSPPAAKSASYCDMPSANSVRRPHGIVLPEELSPKVGSQYRSDPAKTRIFVVDHHSFVRMGLATIIGAEADMTMCGEADDAASALRGIMKLQPDIVVAGIFLPGHSGLELIKTAKDHSPNTRFLVLSSCQESIYGMRVLKAGALGYVMKHDPPAKVIEAIRQIRANQVYVSEETADQLLGHFVGKGIARATSPMESLSDRELDIVNLIGGGLATREIAERLHVSVKTVETHRAHIKSKLNIESPTQLVQYCARWVDANSDEEG